MPFTDSASGRRSSGPAGGRQHAGGLGGVEPEVQDRRIAGELHRQPDIPGRAVDAVQVERDMRRRARQLGAALDRGDEALAQDRRSERQPCRSTAGRARRRREDAEP